MKLKIRFLGTGSGKTSLSRFHSSLLISNSGYNLLIDAGDGISRALLKQKINYNSINGILISHLHPDHFSGFASLIVQMKMEDRKDPLSIFLHQSLIKTVKDFLQSSYIFMERINFPIEFTGFNFNKEISVSPDLTFISRSNSHLKEYEKYDPSLSYACGSFLFKYGGKNIYYSGDLGPSDDLLLFDDFKINLFITEATHINIEDLKKVNEKIKPGKFVLTHLADEDLAELKSKSRKNKNLPILFARDGIILSV